MPRRSALLLLAGSILSPRIVFAKQLGLFERISEERAGLIDLVFAVEAHLVFARTLTGTKFESIGLHAEKMLALCAEELRQAVVALAKYEEHYKSGINSGLVLSAFKDFSQHKSAGELYLKAPSEEFYTLAQANGVKQMPDPAPAQIKSKIKRKGRRTRLVS